MIAGRLRLILAVCLSIGSLYAVVVVLVRARESVVRSRSEALYAEFLKLQTGQTTKFEIEDLRKRFARSLPSSVACGKADCEYTIGSVWGYSRWFQLTKFAHDHMPSSQLTLTTHGDLLSSASFWAGVMVPKGYGTREERKRLAQRDYIPYSSGEYQLQGRASLVAALPEMCCDSRLLSNQEYRIWGPSGYMNCLAIWVSGLSSLSLAKRAEVFDINFNCMTQWSACTDKEDIMPRAGRELAEESASID